MSIYLLQTINGIGIGMLASCWRWGFPSSSACFASSISHTAPSTFWALTFAYQMNQWGMSFWLSLIVVPVAVGAIGWITEKLILRHVYSKPHEFHILITVGFALIVQEVVIMIWGPPEIGVPTPDLLNGVQLHLSQVPSVRDRLSPRCWP